MPWFFQTLILLQKNKNAAQIFKSKMAKEKKQNKRESWSPLTSLMSPT